MFSDAHLKEPALILEIDNPVHLSEISQEDGVFFDTTFASDKRIRTYVYHMLLKACPFLPQGWHFVVFEAYRPQAVQQKQWDEISMQLHLEHPQIDVKSDEFYTMCTRFIADPKIGSGHQSGAAIDVSLQDDKGALCDMGSPLNGLCDAAETDYPDLTPKAKENRHILKNALESVGFINYPSEWWHYSFGDRLWAKLTGSKIAIFGKLDI